MWSIMILLFSVFCIIIWSILVLFFIFCLQKGIWVFLKYLIIVNFGLISLLLFIGFVCFMYYWRVKLFRIIVIFCFRLIWFFFFGIILLIRSMQMNWFGSFWNLFYWKCYKVNDLIIFYRNCLVILVLLIGCLNGRVICSLVMMSLLKLYLLIFLKLLWVYWNFKFFKID